jgi:hypothetical protein
MLRAGPGETLPGPTALRRGAMLCNVLGEGSREAATWRG